MENNLSELEILREENLHLKRKLSSALDVLRFCARPDAGTYYQQQSAKKFVLEGIKIVWDRHNPNGSYNEEYKNWILKTSGQEVLNEVLAIEKELGM
jgi:hypothetical protein